MPSEETQNIKRSIVHRAKYRVRDGKNRYLPSHVVPHPSNRGGGPMAPTRLRLISGSLTYDGYDLTEANTNGCCVKQRPVSEVGTGTYFQDNLF